MSSSVSRTVKSADWIVGAGASRLSLFDELSAWSGQSQLSEACKTLDDDITNLSAVLHAFRVRRNALAAVTWLPTEILVLIFKALASVYPPGHRRRPRCMGWVGITHVCRRWREAAIDCPVLWAKIDVAFPARWMEVFMERASLMPLDITLDVPVSAHLDGRQMELILEHLPHTRSLSFDIQRDDQIALFGRILASRAPLLEFLSVKRMGSALPIKMPKILFSGDAPKLNSICVRDISELPWPTLASTRLETLWLSIEKQPPASHHPPLAQILTFFSHMTTLRTITLVNFVPRASEQAPLSTEHFTLPRLTSFTIAGDAADCTSLLARLRMPCLERLELMLTASNGLDYALLFPVVAGHLGGRRAAPIDLLSFFSDNPDEVMEVALHREPTDAASLSSVNLFLRWDWDTSSTHLMKTLCALLPRGEVATVEVDVRISSEWSDLWNVKEWLDIFGRLKGVRTLKLTCEPIEAICEALTMSTSTSQQVVDLSEWEVPRKNPDGRKRYFFLPDLSTLVVRRTEISPLLAPALKERKDAQTRLRRLSIAECWTAAECVDKLRDIVKEVEWDDVENGYVEDEAQFM